MSFDFLFKPISKLNLADDGTGLVVMVWIVTAMVRVLLGMCWGV